MVQGLKNFWEDLCDLQSASLRVGVIGMGAILLVFVIALTVYRVFVSISN